MSLRTMASVVDFLVVEGRIPRDRVSKIVETMPSLLSHSVDRNLRPKIFFLVEDVGIAPEGLAAVLLKFPQVLGLSVQSNLRPTVRYLTEELGVSPADLSRILASMPQLLGLSVQGNLFRVPNDQVTTPTYTKDLALVTSELLAKKASGIFNVVAGH